MNTRTQRSWSLGRGLGVSFAVPLLIFIAALLPQIWSPSQWQLPRRVKVNAPPECREVTIRPVARKGEPACSEIDVKDRTDVDAYLCDPQTWDEENWWITLAVDTRHIDPQCNLRIFALDKQSSDVRPTDENRAYQHFSCQEVPGQTICRLEGKPWRTYTVVALVLDGAFAGQPKIIAVAQRSGANVRREALLSFLGVSALAALLMWLLYALRPYGPSSLRWFEKARWRAVATMSAAAGFVTGCLSALRPPDLGGRDEPTPWSGVIAVSAIVAILSAFAGCLFDTSRRLLHQRKRQWEAWLIALMVTAFVAFVPHFVREWFAHHTRPHANVSWLSAKEAYYLYFALASAYPLVFVREPAFGRHRSVPQKTVPPTRSRALRLFGLAMLNGVLASIIGYSAVALINEPIEGQIFSGFYKPAGILGKLISTAPLLAAFAFAIHVGEERPTWVQYLDMCVSGLLTSVSSIERAQHFQNALLLLVQHVDDIGRYERFLTRSALALLPLRSTMNPSDIEQLAERSNIGITKERLDQVFTALERTQLGATKLQTPLLLVDRARGTGTIGQLVLTAALQADEQPEIIVRQNAFPTQFNSVLDQEVRRTLRRVLELATSGDDESLPLSRRTLFVDFQYDGQTDISGRSYQLPLALMTWALATGDTFVIERWVATGGLDLHLAITSVEGLDEKLRAATSRYNLALTPAQGDVPGAASNDEHARHWTLTADDEDVGDVARNAQEHVGYGGRAIVGVRNLTQAITLLFDVDV